MTTWAVGTTLRYKKDLSVSIGLGVLQLPFWRNALSGTGFMVVNFFPAPGSRILLARFLLRFFWPIFLTPAFFVVNPGQTLLPELFSLTDDFF